MLLIILSTFCRCCCQLAGDTCLFQSAEKIEKAAKTNLFDNITVDKILDNKVLYNENYILLCLCVCLNNQSKPEV